MSRIVIDEDRCKGCLLCTTVCPKEILEQADHLNRQGYKPAAMKAGAEDKCTACTSCAQMCPDAAITVYRTKSA